MAEFKNRKKYDPKQESKKIADTYRDISLTKMGKRQLFTILLSILGVTILSIGSTFAIFRTSVKSSDYNVIKVGTLNIDFGTDADNVISLSNQYPVTDTAGQASTPYTFTITNTGSLTADYTIKLVDDTDMITQDGCDDIQLNKAYMKFSLDGGTPAILGNISSNNYAISTGTLEAGESKTYNLRVWISNNADNSVLNKHYHGKIVVEGNNSQPIDMTTMTAADYLIARSAKDTDIVADSHSETYATPAGTDYRYIGYSPNNYVMLNDELFRIIGVMPTDDGTGEFQNMVKIIKFDYGEAQPFSDSQPIWETSNALDWVNTVYDSIGSPSQFSTAVWYLGGMSFDYYDGIGWPAEYIYDQERGNQFFLNETYTGTGAIIYPSDFIYATSGGSNMDRESCLSNAEGWYGTDYTDCSMYNWIQIAAGLISQGRTMWTIMPETTYSFEWYIQSSDSKAYIDALEGEVDISRFIYPTYYLKSDVKFSSGSGTSSDPYIIDLS